MEDDEDDDPEPPEAAVDSAALFLGFLFCLSPLDPPFFPIHNIGRARERDLELGLWHVLECSG